MNLAERLDRDPAEWWEHEEGDRLIGVVVDRGTRLSEFGAYEVISVEVTEASTEKGGKKIPVGEERAYHASSSIGKQDVPKLDPRIGDGFGVKYLGVPEGKDYKLYRHRLDRRSEPPPLIEDEIDPAAADIPF